MNISQASCTSSAVTYFIMHQSDRGLRFLVKPASSLMAKSRRWPGIYFSKILQLLKAPTRLVFQKPVKKSLFSGNPVVTSPCELKCKIQSLLVLADSRAT